MEICIKYDILLIIIISVIVIVTIIYIRDYFLIIVHKIFSYINLTQFIVSKRRFINIIKIIHWTFYTYYNMNLNIFYLIH
jgi:hypothetical protein